MNIIEALKRLKKLKIILKAAIDLECSLTLSSYDCKKFYEALNTIDNQKEKP